MSLYSSPQDPHQFELFSSPEEQSSGKKSAFSKKIPVAVEHLIITFIAVLVLGVVVFSIGVERGKHSIVQKNANLEINFANSANDAIITPSSEPLKQPVSVRPAAAAQAAVSASAAAAIAATKEIVVDVPVPAEIPAKDVAAPTGVYTVQVASFKQKKFADQEVTDLKRKGQDAFTMSKGDYYLVCVGKYKTSAQADKTSKSLRSKYKDNLIRRL